jgi:CO/xanthine dehydrogenase Mo-binding subunit
MSFAGLRTRHNPMTVEGQLQGGLVNSLGYAPYEDICINRYKLPSTLDTPILDVNIFENHPLPDAFGAIGVGMSGVIGVPAAVASVSYDAVGVRLNAMPFTPERIVKALAEKNKAVQIQLKNVQVITQRKADFKLPDF